MKRQIVVMVIGTVLAVAGRDPTRAESNWSFELGSPLWECLIECAGVGGSEELRVCLETCGEAHDGVTARERADVLRCQASLMRAEAAQFACHSHCLSAGEGTHMVGCIDACNRRYELKTTLIMRTARCEAMRSRN